ncbi:MAG: polysaccharide biosynthesis/export family protein [Elusimicrobiales bacterium]
MARIIVAALVLFNCVCGAFAQTPPETKIPALPDTAYRLLQGDVLNIVVFPAREFSREVMIQPDGTVEMAMTGPVHVMGATTSEVETMLEQKLAAYVNKPQVSVNIKSFADRKVLSAGEITTPGVYDYKDGMRVLDLVSRSGGFKDNARLSKIRVFRRQGGSTTMIEVNMESFLAGDLSENFQLMPQDILYVPIKPVTKSARWISDNFVPWATLFTFGITLSLLAHR